MQAARRTVVADALVRAEDERVALSGEDLDVIDCEWLVIYTVGLNDDELMTIDGKNKVRVARNRDKTETISTR